MGERPAVSGANAVYVTISGESNAVSGYPFPPSDRTNDTYLFDGWQFVIEKYIVNVDRVTLWSNPDQAPTDQSKHGPAVAHLHGCTQTNAGAGADARSRRRGT